MTIVRTYVSLRLKYYLSSDSLFTHLLVFNIIDDVSIRLYTRETYTVNNVSHEASKRLCQMLGAEVGPFPTQVQLSKQLQRAAQLFTQVMLYSQSAHFSQKFSRFLVLT